MRVRAVGSTFAGVPFQREQTLSAAVYLGATNPPQTGGLLSCACELLRCLLGEDVLSRELLERLRAAGLNIDELVKCIDSHCGQNKAIALR